MQFTQVLNLYVLVKWADNLCLAMSNWFNFNNGRSFELLDAYLIPFVAGNNCPHVIQMFVVKNVVIVY